MMEFSRLSVLIVGELLIGLAILSSALIAYGVIKKNKIRQAAQQLVARVQNDKESRAERLKNRLAGSYQYAGEELKKALHDLSQAEMRLYQNIINGYLRQDTSAIQQVDVDVDHLLLAYQGLKLPENGAGGASETGTTGDASAEIQRLQDENERLTEELGVTMDTIARMLNEYSSMYADGSDNQLGKGKLMGMNQEGQVDSQEEEETKGQDVSSVQQIEDAILPEPENELTSQEDSPINDPEQVVIELSDRGEGATEDETAEAGSLEEEWAKLLEEDVESPEKIAQEEPTEQMKVL